MSNKVSTSEMKNIYIYILRAFCYNSDNLLCHRAQQISLAVVFFFFAVKNCALKNFLGKNLTIK